MIAERLGLDRDEALTFGRAVAGLSAHTKGASLGAESARADPDQIESLAINLIGANRLLSKELEHVLVGKVG